MTNKRQLCSLCRSFSLTSVLQLGSSPLANEYLKSADEISERYWLDVVMCSVCGHSQIGHLVDSAVLFKDYAYATSTSQVTLDHLMNEALEVKAQHRILSKLPLGEKAFVLEIGCNDGSMLDIWKKLGVGRVLGVDPAASKLKAYDVDTMDAFFNKKLGEEIAKTHGKANVVVANNVFAHVPDVLDVAEGVKEALADEGLFVFEVSYLLDMAEAPLFDTIYHEHMSYHAVKPLALMLDRLGMPIVEAKRLTGQRGRGSLRITARKGPGRSLDCGAARCLMLDEAQENLWDPVFWRRLSFKIETAGKAMRSWISALKSLGERVVGYGAAAKMTTLMHVFNLNGTHIEYIVDDSKWKQGLFTPGLKIPIVSPESFINDSPGACVIFAWNFAESIVMRHQRYKGRWILPLPELQEISA